MGSCLGAETGRCRLFVFCRLRSGTCGSNDSMADWTSEIGSAIDDSDELDWVRGLNGLEKEWKEDGLREGLRGSIPLRPPAMWVDSDCSVVGHADARAPSSIPTASTGRTKSVANVGSDGSPRLYVHRRLTCASSESPCLQSEPMRRNHRDRRSITRQHGYMRVDSDA